MRILMIALAAMVLMASSQAVAYCFSSEEIERRSAKHWASYIWKRADVILEATVARRWRPSVPEQLTASRVIKGPKQRAFTLANPDTLTSIASPSTGLREGESGIVALTQKSDGYFVSECIAGPLGRSDVQAKLSAWTRSK